MRRNSVQKSNAKKKGKTTGGNAARAKAKAKMSSVAAFAKLKAVKPTAPEDPEDEDDSSGSDDPAKTELSGFDKIMNDCPILKSLSEELEKLKTSDPTRMNFISDVNDDDLDEELKNFSFLDSDITIPTLSDEGPDEKEQTFLFGDVGSHMATYDDGPTEEPPKPTDEDPESSDDEELVRSNNHVRIAADTLSTNIAPVKGLRGAVGKVQRKELTGTSLQLRSNEAAIGRRVYEEVSLVVEYSDDELQDDDEHTKRVKNAKSKFMDMYKPKEEPKEEPPPIDHKSLGLWDATDITDPDALTNLAAIAPKQRVWKPTEWEMAVEEIQRAKEKEKLKSGKQGLLDVVAQAAKEQLFKTGKYLRDDDIAWCARNTNFKEKEVRLWFKTFRKACPKGMLTKLQMIKLFKRIFPKGSGDIFSHHFFNIFDKDGNGSLDFKEFLVAMNVTTCKTTEDKLKWAFGIYDVDRNGVVTLDEMIRIIEIIDQVRYDPDLSETYFIPMESDTDADDYDPFDYGEPLRPAEERAAELYELMDLDEDGQITYEEFTRVGLKLLDDNHTASGNLIFGY